jgi:hypothetical protein
MTTTVESVKLGRFTITRGSPVRVKPRGTKRAKPGTYLVGSIVTLDDGTTKVEARHPEHAAAKFYYLDEIEYVRPSTRRARDAAFVAETARIETRALVKRKRGQR